MINGTNYATTDLFLIASFDLASLAESLVHSGLLPYYVGPYVGPYQDGSWSARFAIGGDRHQEPDLDIASLLTVMEALPKPSRALWEACILREFDIAYNCTAQSEDLQQQLSAATLTRIAALGASIRITLYPWTETEASDAAIQILKKDKSIKKHLGKFNGSGFPDSPSLEEVKVTIYGTKGHVRVHCLMELNQQEKWTVKEIKSIEKLPLPPS
ncbi:hypothetical protein AHMF7605_21540 [Adhaeribacter arboris]|uniref:Uncharacterized protein n=1 Tax=Adhaeribacter arboris TaxID=2072846 RepID=A0A2T2YK70_9BACT|nr:hypothetical protein [Adhaeribacter arboris]PSR55900.1 hypothetical protein AHMF7605_21540 [Adhaeribacter arboris]